MKKLAPFRRLTERDVDNKNKAIPIGIFMKPMRPQLNGKSFSMNRVMDFERVKLGSIKKIKIFHDHGPMKMDGDKKMDKGMDMRGESLFLRKLVLGIPAQASGKNLTRPLMPSAPQTSCVRATSPLPS